MESKYMNVKEAAEYLRCSTSKVYKKAAAGKLPGLKNGISWLFTAEALDKHLEKHSNAPRIRRIV